MKLALRAHPEREVADTRCVSNRRLPSVLLMHARAGFVVVGVLVLGSAKVLAEPGIVIEATDGEPTASAAVIAPVLTDLEHRGYLGGDALAQRIETTVSGAPGALSPTQSVDAQRTIDSAYQHFIDGDYDRALAAAQQALATYAIGTGQLGHEPALRALQRKAFYIAARSAEVLGRSDDAFSIMAEAVRTFPDDHPSSTEFDPRVGALHRRVKDELTRQGQASLEVRTDDPAVVIFIDERFAGTGTVKLDGLLPGRYRVYTEKGRAPGRVRVVEVAPGVAASVSVPWLVDGVIRTIAQRVVIDLHDLPQGTEWHVALSIGRALGVPRVIILRSRPLDGRAAIVGMSITVESQTRTFGAVQLEPVAPTRTTLLALASLLAGNKSAAAPGLITTEPSPTIADREPPAVPLTRRRKIALAIGTVALASAGAALGFELSSRSTYDQSTREPNDARQNALYDSANRKYQVAQGFAIGAAACALAAGILWWRGTPEAPTPLVGVSTDGTGVSFAVAGRF